MSKERAKSLLISIEANLIDAQKICDESNELLLNSFVLFGPDVSFEEKSFQWAMARGNLKGAAHELSSSMNLLKDEWQELEEICDDLTKESIAIMKELDKKYNRHDLLISMRKITTKIENKIILIDELKSSVIESFTHIEAFRQNSTAIPSSRDAFSENNNTSGVYTSVRTIAVKVPEFNGEIENFAEFISAFNDLIHFNSSYPNSIKAIHLKGALKGNSGRCISGIPVTGENYQSMYEKVVSKFSRVSLNKHTIVQKLEAMEQAKGDARSMQDKIDEIEEVLNQFNTAKIGIDHETNPIWHRIILRKFPEDISRGIVKENHNHDDFTVRELVESIEKEIFSIKFHEQANIANKGYQAPQREMRTSFNIYDGPRNSGNLINDGRTNAHSPMSNRNNVGFTNSYSQHSCSLCDSRAHTSDCCNLPLLEKIRSVKRRKLCWKCFQSNHSSFHCSAANCPCGDPHHHSLCKRNDRNSRPTWNGDNRNYATQNNVNFNERQYNQHGNRHQNNTFLRPQNEFHNVNPNFENTRNQRIIEPNHVPFRANNRNFSGNQQNNGPVNGELNQQRLTTQSYRNHAALIEDSSTSPGIVVEDGEDLQVNHTAIETKTILPEAAILMTCEASIFNHQSQKFIPVIVFFDSGSQQTLINEGLAEQLGITDGKISTFSVSGINGTTAKFSGRKITLELLDKAGTTIKFEALTKPFISKGFRAANLDTGDLSFIAKSGLKIANSKLQGEMLKPDILIGADIYAKLTVNKPAIELPSKLLLIHTVFGHCVFGKKEDSAAHKSKPETTELVVNTAIIENEIEELTPNRMIKEMYEIESLGIKHAGSTSMENTVRYFENYKKLINFENNMVTAPFPLKDDIMKLHSNWKIAQVRLNALMNMLSKNEEMKECYVRKMESYIKDGIIEIINDQNECISSVGTYYIPHHGVWSPVKTLKPLRIVFDASSCQKGCISLNQAIHTGESFVNKIPNIVLAARKSKYIIMSDIEGAYTQIRLPVEHRDLCRLVWLENPDKPATKDNIRSYRFNRLPFGVNASASILNMAIVAFLETNGTELASEILKHLYVDNIILTVDDKADIWEKIKESKRMFKEIALNNREYVTNVNEINEAIPEEDKGKFGETKILGVGYNTKTDELKVKFSVKEEIRVTRRTIVKQLHTVFDPNGLLAPAMISLRFMMREAFAVTNHWNDVIPEDIAYEWRVLIERYNHAKITIPRYLGSEHKIVENQTLWVFTDASKQAFAACAYLQDSTTRKVSTLLSGKAKMTPKVKIPLEDTIPKFELTSILLGMELAKSVIESLELANCKLCIVNDSTSALSWVTLSKRLRKSCELIRDKIVHLVKTLQNDYDMSTQFFHCTTELNTADIATRGISPHLLQENDWIQGPQWLTKPPAELPLTPYMLNEEKQAVNDEEPNEGIKVNQAVVKEFEPSIFNLEKYSTATEAKFGIAKILNLIKRKVQEVRNRLGNRTKMNPLWDDLSMKNYPSRKDLAIAEKFILLDEQRNLELQTLKVKYHQRELVTDEYGLIRFQSRIQNAELEYDTKNPVFIPNQSTFLKLLINEYHIETGHSGKEYLRMLIRQRFWIPKPTKAINAILKKCLPCRIDSSLPFRAPNMPSLPKDRVKSLRAFENTGVDVMGPFQTVEYEKVYICLFTCLVVRAVHLEILNDLSGSEFLKSFIRFTSRRGIPKLMRSDNGTNFVLAAKVLDVIYENEDKGQNVDIYSKQNGIQWIFNPPKAPFMGGVWERLVRTVKSAFFKSIGRMKLTFSEFQTAIVKIEAIVNSRPLTAVDNEDFIKPLRPCDFICPGAELIIPSSANEIDDPDFEPYSLSNVDEAKERLIAIETILERFWSRFKTEYLVSLRDHQRLRIKQGKCASSKLPKVNELVLIEDDLLPKHRWNIGKITKLCTSKDGKIRSAMLSCNGNTLQRPIIYLYSLEIYEQNEETSSKTNDVESLKEDKVTEETETELNKDLEDKEGESIGRRIRRPAVRYVDLVDYDYSEAKYSSRAAQRH